jgi:hypothetical protein
MLLLILLGACQPGDSSFPPEVEVVLSLDDGSVFTQTVQVDYFPTGGTSAVDSCLDATVVSAVVAEFDLGDPAFPSLYVGASTRSYPGDVETVYTDDGGIDQLAVDGELYEWHGTLTIESADESFLEIALSEGLFCPFWTVDECTPMGGSLTIGGTREIADAPFASAAGEWADVNTGEPYCAVTEYQAPSTSDAE